MASGRKNRGSRHRSHRHKQQKGDDSGDSDAEQNLRHGPNPYPNSSSPWTMEPLPPNVEGPSVLKQPDMENVDRDSQHTSQGSTAKRRKESFSVVGDTGSVMDRWDGGGGTDEAATLSYLGVTERNPIVLGDGFSRKESRGESEGRNSKGKSRATPAVSSSKGLEHADSNPTEISTHSILTTDIIRDSKGVGSVDGNLAEFAAGHTPGFDGSESAKARVSRSSHKEKESEDALSLANMSADVEKRRSRKNDLSQKSKKLEAAGNLIALESKEEHHNFLEKGTTGVIQDVVRNLELEKELESRIRRRSEGSGDRDRWRDGSKDREVKGSRFHAEEHYQTDIRVKDEKVRQEKAKDDSMVKTGRERSSSRHRDEGWKAGRHLEEKQKEESLHIGTGREGWLKHEKEHEQRRKSDRGRGDRSIEVKGKDDKQEEVTSNREDLKSSRSKDSFKEAKERDGRATEGRHKENRSKESRYRDDKSREFRSKIEVGIVEDRRLTSENIKREYPNQEKEEKTTFDGHHDEIKRESDRAKEDRSKPKDRSGKFDESVKEEKERVEKHRDEGAAYMKSKNEKRRESEQEDSFRHKEDAGLDVADGKGKRRSEREHDQSTRYSKRSNEEGDTEKHHDDKDRDERQKLDTHVQRENQHVNGKQAEHLAKYEARHELNDRDGHSRDAWPSGDRRGQEKVKDDGGKHSKRRDESQERRWSSGIHDERAKSSKEFYDRQKQSREMDDRQRYGLFNAGKQRGERGKDDRKQTEKLKEDKHEEMPVPVFERLGGTREANRRNDGGEKDSRRNNLDKSYDQYIKKSKDLDGHAKPKGVRDLVEPRESKGYSTNKGDRTVSKATRSTSSQDQERILSVAGAKDASTSENLPKRNLDSDMFDLVDRDFARPRGRPVEEASGLLHEDRPFHDKSVRKSKFETSVSSSSGTRRPREPNWQSMNHADQGKSYPAGLDEEVRSWEPRVSNQDSDDERRRPFSHERTREPLSPRGPLARGHEDFVRGPESILSKEAAMSKRKHDNFSQGAAGPTKHRRVEDTSAERVDWSHQGTQGNRPLPNRHFGSLALLPPPPPYRPGVDNPTVMGAPGNFGEGSTSRDSGRYDRKVGGGHSRRSEMVGDTWGGFGMGNWNAHNQGPVPGPGSLFPSFPQMASGFLGMGQQFHVPQAFGPNGSRPVNMGFGPGRFRMGDGGAGFPGHGSDHGPVMGWHRFSDGSESHRPLSGFMHTWEGSGRFPDERQRFAHPEWDQFSQGLSVGGWEGVSEPWQGQIGDVNFDSHRQREDLYQARREDVPWPESETEKVQPVEDNMVVETVEISHVGVNDATENYVSKASKHTKERMQMLLLHADVCADLVDHELYKEYLSLLPPSEARRREASLQNQVEASTVFMDEDLVFEVDSEAQELLLSENPCATLLPTLSEDVYKAALKVFQKPVKENQVQKSLVGSFLLPKSISALSRPRLNKEIMKGNVGAISEDQACVLKENGGAISEDQACVLLGPREAESEITEGMETAGAKLAEESSCAIGDGEMTDNAVVDHGEELGAASLSVLSDEKALIMQPMGCTPLESEQTFPVNVIDEEVSAESPSALRVAEIEQTSAQITDSLSPPSPLLEAQQETDKELFLEDLPEKKLEAFSLSSIKVEELEGNFENIESTMVDEPRDKHRHQVSLESAHHAIIP